MKAVKEFGIKEPFMTATEVAKVLGIGMTKSYATIKLLNKELEKKGFLVVRGKIQRQYLYQRYGIKETEEE